MARTGESRKPFVHKLCGLTCRRHQTIACPAPAVDIWLGGRSPTGTLNQNAKRQSWSTYQAAEVVSQVLTDRASWQSTRLSRGDPHGLPQFRPA